jgi:hypothetical protein
MYFSGPTLVPKVARDGSKTAKILDLLKRPGGVTSKDLMKATGWLPHSVRGFAGQARAVLLAAVSGRAAGVRIDFAKDLGVAPADWIGRGGREENRLKEGGWDDRQPFTYLVLPGSGKPGFGI